MINNCKTKVNTDSTNMQTKTCVDLESKQFHFIRHKSLGRGNISYISSDVAIANAVLTLKQQKIILYFFKRKPIETVHNIMDIASIRIVRTFDISDTIFSIIFALLGFYRPAFFIVAILFLWVSIGKKIELKMTNNSTISIPAENYKLCYKLMQALVSINKSIVIEGKSI